jgi:lipoprotein-anchoring transpeptidase ErfK/SrfK
MEINREYHLLRVAALTMLFLSVAPVSGWAAEPEALAVQAALDRAGFSPGVIDGKMGSQTTKALRGFQEAKGLKLSGSLDAETKAALGQGEGTATIEVTQADAAGPFAPDIPESMEEKAKLPALSYSSLEEALAEKYHTTLAVLKALNANADFEPGTRIVVPNISPAAATPQRAGKEKTDNKKVDTAKVDWDATLAKLSVAADQPSAARLVVDKSEKTVRVLDASGKLLSQFPATIGSAHDPLPLGSWKIRGVAKLPPFNYNPDLFWDAAPGDKKAKLPAGPNSPVGVVWIDLSKEHYGIHGTPHPETIGRTESHGCIRLTNWDAAKLAQMVRPGTPILLRN